MGGHGPPVGHAFAVTTPAHRMYDMDWPDYLRDQAANYRQLAEQAEDPVIKNEMLELASVCEEVAMISRTISQAGRVDPFWGKLSTVFAGG